jgi:hypothetical protein
MNALETAYWAGARDAATVIFSDLSHYPGVRWRARKRARDLLIAVNRLGGRELESMVREELQHFHRR